MRHLSFMRYQLMSLFNTVPFPYSLFILTIYELLRHRLRPRKFFDGDDSFFHLPDYVCQSILRHLRFAD